jgi:hypothetical protein
MIAPTIFREKVLHSTGNYRRRDQRKCGKLP